MDFLYQYFFEVISEEGIWVLILIGAAFSVASFILLTMRMEASPPRQREIRQLQNTNQIEKKLKGKKLKNTGKREKIESRILEEQELEHSMEIELEQEKQSYTEQEKEEEPGKNKRSILKILSIKRPKKTEEKQEQEPEQEQEQEEDITYQNESSLPLRPELVPPDSFIKPEIGLSGLNDLEIASIPETNGTSGQAKAQPKAPLPPTEQMSTPGIDPFEVAPIPEEAKLAFDSTEPENIDDSDTDSGNEQKAGGNDDDLFNLLQEANYEESDTTLFAKELEDVELDGLLTETENLAETLKGIFPKDGKT